MKRREIKGVHLNLSKTDSDSKNKLIMVEGPPFYYSRNRTYQVLYFSKQQDAILKIAEALYDDNEEFPSHLVEADRNDLNDSQRWTRYAAEEKSKLPGRSVHEVKDVFVEVGLNIGQKYTLANVMCLAADVSFSKERSIEI